MNFFAEQDRARSKTGWLVICLIAAVIGLIAITTLAVAAFISVLHQYSGDYRIDQTANTGAIDQFLAMLTPQLTGSVAAVVLIVVVMASLYKLMQLSRGGKEVALALGGRLINTDTRDADERKLLNVVEEMSIASGNPVPEVYLLEDGAINAFAAGFGRHDAVIGVTRGCIQQLDRDELQGVIAHEFSHIHFGDMRLNMRLVALLHGILIIGLVGYFVLRSTGVSRRKNAGAQLALGLGLIIIGYCGTFFGNIIKAAVSRQREFLADASAVQFTRNPQGIANALKKIGGWRHGSKLESRHAAEYSHLYFSNGISQILGSVLATHPPLEERIRRIDKRWDGSFTDTQPIAPRESGADMSGRDDRTAAFAAVGLSSAGQSVTQLNETIGNPGSGHIAFARDLLDRLPDELTKAVHEPYSARAIIYALLLDDSTAKRHTQMNHLQENADAQTFRIIETISSLVAPLPRRQHLPLLELCIPTLKQLSRPQYKVFKGNMAALIRADKKISLFEWALYRTLTHSMEDARPRVATHLKKQQRNCQLLLSAVCYAGKNSRAEIAYGAGAKILGLSPEFQLVGAANIPFNELDQALDALAGLRPLEKPRLLKALGACIHADEKVTADEAELFRAVADSLDCPVPPLVAT
jgi:Zn-dependent protease with chaperone function